MCLLLDRSGHLMPASVHTPYARARVRNVPFANRGAPSTCLGRFAHRAPQCVWLGMPRSRCEASAGDLGPGFEGLGSGGSVVGDGAVVSAKVEEVGDRVVDGEKSLDLASRLEAFHLPFSSPRRLMGV